MSYGKGAKGFEKAFEAVVKAEHGEANWDAILVCCDIIRDGGVKHAYAVEKVQRTLESSTPSQNMLVLQMLESATKNCGSKLHAAIADKKFMQFLRDHITRSTGVVKHKLLELIQIWNHAFRNQPEYSAIAEVYLQLKGAGQEFPTLVESDAMFSTDGPPDWREDSSCYSCETKFTQFTRRHHCRNCGQSCCGKCSSKYIPIPKYGYQKDVRVCDKCFTKITEEPSTGGKGGSSSTSKASLDNDLDAAIKQSLAESQSKAKPAGGKSKQEIEDEEQLQLAIAISQSEAEAKESERKKRSNFMSLDAQPPAGVTSSISSSHAPTAPVMPEIDDSTMTPELQKYLNRNYWQNKQADTQATATPASATVKVTQPSAPPASVDSPVYATISKPFETPQVQTITPSYQPSPASIQVEEDPERAEFNSALSSSIDVFVNRMKSNSMRGRSIVNDNSVQTIFATLQNMHPQLLTYIQAQEDKRSENESLQDKLAQLRDAREALDQLRSEHQEKRKREAEELERRKQIQMAQKLEILRQKKQELLEVRRQDALLRLAQKDAEMRARFEQQKQQAQLRQWQLHGFPQELQPGFAGAPGMQPGEMSQYTQAGQFQGYQQQGYSSEQQMYQQPQPVPDTNGYQNGVYMQMAQQPGPPNASQQAPQGVPGGGGGYPAYPQGAPGMQQPSQQTVPSLNQQNPQGTPGISGMPQPLPQAQNVPSMQSQVPQQQTPQSAPGMQAHVPQGTAGQQMPGAAGNYYQGQAPNPYNMQGMNEALPPGYSQGQPAPGYSQSVPSQQHGMMQGQVSGQIQQGMPYQQPQQQPQPPPQAQDVTQLISFD